MKNTQPMFKQEMLRIYAAIKTLRKKLENPKHPDRKDNLLRGLNRLHSAAINLHEDIDNQITLENGKTCKL